MTQGYKSWYHSMTNVSIPEVNMLKNSSTLAVSVAINYSIKLGFVSLNGPRETYFVTCYVILLPTYHNHCYSFPIAFSQQTYVRFLVV